jgi:hypothetical protein
LRRTIEQRRQRWIENIAGIARGLETNEG